MPDHTQLYRRALAELADAYHPERPGGWPGGDPQGSYL